jgi:uncharacterized protein
MSIQQATPDKYFLRLGLVFLLALCLPLMAQGPELQPAGHINDFARVLSGQAKSQLEMVAAEVKQKAGAEIAVAIVKSLDGDTVENFANILAERWGVGDKEDRGALILLAIEDRKIRIEVGYGLEPIIPDGRAGEIRENMRPHLQAGAYDMAITTGVVELSRIIAQDAGVTLTMLGRAQPAQAGRGRRRRSRGFGIWSLLFFLPFLFMRRRRNGGWYGGAMTSAWMLGSLGGGRGFGGGNSGIGSGGFGGFGGGGFGGGGASGSW